MAEAAKKAAVKTGFNTGLFLPRRRDRSAAISSVLGRGMSPAAFGNHPVNRDLVLRDDTQ
jgi:hypothetical protein